MKRICTVILTVAFYLIVMVGSSLSVENKIRVVTTTSDLKSITEFVGGDRVKVASITAGYQDPHFVETKPSYMIKVRKADLFIRIGLELELAWESPIIEGSRNPKIKVGSIGHLDASDSIERLQVPTKKIDRSMGDIHPFGNPHYWLDPLNAKIIANNIARRLAKISPEDKDYFVQNAVQFSRKIDEKMKEWNQKISPYKGNRIVTYHKSWPYFTRRFGLIVAEHLESKPGIPPSSRHILEVIKKMRADNINVILMEPFYSDKPANLIASKTGAKIIKIANSVGGMKGTDDYISLIDKIIEGLAVAFRSTGEQ